MSLGPCTTSHSSRPILGARGALSLPNVAFTGWVRQVAGLPMSCRYVTSSSSGRRRADPAAPNHDDRTELTVSKQPNTQYSELWAFRAAGFPVSRLPSCRVAPACRRRRPCSAMAQSVVRGTSCALRAVPRLARHGPALRSSGKRGVSSIAQEGQQRVGFASPRLFHVVYSVADQGVGRHSY